MLTRTVDKTYLTVEPFKKKNVFHFQFIHIIQCDLENIRPSPKNSEVV